MTVAVEIPIDVVCDDCARGFAGGEIESAMADSRKRRRYRSAFRRLASVHAARCGAFTRRIAACSASMRKFAPTR